MEMPAELKEPDQPDWNKYKLLPTRKDIVYRNDGGYQLSITHVPWRQKEFTLQRYRLSQAQDLALVDEKSVKGDTLKLSNSLPPDSVIVLQQK